MEPNFNLNRPPVSDEEINSKKDFGELVNKFKKQSIEKARSDSSFLKNKKVTYSAIIAGVAVVCTVTYFSVFKKQPPKQTTDDKTITLNDSHKNTTDTKASKAFIVPPVSKLNVPYASYKVNADKGGTIKHTKSNSKIIIPQKAFVNKQGQDIVGDVEIRYREFHNQADIIASGIPMAYDSAGVKSQLESAGMLDIRGYQDNEPVFIKPDKTITVEFESQHPQDKYNMYVLDTIARNWVYTGRDNSLREHPQNKTHQQVTTEQDKVVETPKTKELQKQIDAIPPKIETEKVAYEKKVSQLSKAVIPTKPLKATTGRPQFLLDVNYKEFPELEAFKNAVFEVGTENKNYNSEFSKITWTSAEIAEGPQKGRNYLLILTQINRVEKLIVYPALTGANYDNAVKTYESKFEEYKTAAAKRAANEKKLKEEFEERQAKFIAENKKLYEELTKERIRLMREQEPKLNEQMASFDNSQKAMRVFKINSFGICNSDCPNSMPSGATMNPVFLVNSSPVMNPGTVYLVCHGKNVVYNFNYEPIKYNPKEKYSVCVLAHGKFFVCDQEAFSKCVASNQNKLPVKELEEDADATSLKIALGI
jgi:hypothetical protein